jgi:pyridinium-3,5-bisthiocarboxylic acid mononucleotide nickel chelatase
MVKGRIAILDPAAGISGDMLLGALLDAGAPRTWLEGLPARLGLSEARVEISRVLRCGITATKATVRWRDGESELPARDFGAPHEHAHQLHHPLPPDHNSAEHHVHPGGPVPHHRHRHVRELVGILEQAQLSERVRSAAIRAFRLLAEAEGAIHGVSPDAVALHEVGAVDALIDIVGGIEGFEQLDIERVYSRPVSLGRGWVHAAHGVMAVPAPVTLRLLEGIEIGPDGPVLGEATTPTGAVLLRVLSVGTPPGRWRALASGWGAGGRDPVDYPNALRLVIAEPASEAAEVVTLSTDLDDLSPEYLEPLREALSSAGALDVQVWPTHMKKGRTGFRLEVVVESGLVDVVTEALFLHSTTAGIRRWNAERVTLPRSIMEVEAAPGIVVRVKVLQAPGGARVKPEFDDVSAAARRLGRPAHEIAREVQTRALAMVATGAIGVSRQPKKEP